MFALSREELGGKSLAVFDFVLTVPELTCDSFSAYKEADCFHYFMILKTRDVGEHKISFEKYSKGYKVFATDLFKILSGDTA